MKELIRKILILVCACVFVYSAYQLAIICFDYNKIEKESENLIDNYVEEPKEDSVEKEVDPLERVIKFDELLQINTDLIGWIYIPGTSVDEPLVQGEDNNTYLYKSFRKQKNKAGAIFVDENNNRDLTDSNTIIHGHNMSNGARFHDLRYFVKNDYYKSHPFIYIYLPDGSINVYEVFASDKISAYSNLYTANINYTSYVKSVQKGASQKTEVSDQESPIIMLSTCYKSQSEDRYVVYGRLKENVRVN